MNYYLNTNCNFSEIHFCYINSVLIIGFFVIFALILASLISLGFCFCEKLAIELIYCTHAALFVQINPPAVFQGMKLLSVYCSIAQICITEIRIILWFLIGIKTIMKQNYGHDYFGLVSALGSVYINSGSIIAIRILIPHKKSRLNCCHIDSFLLLRLG